MLVYKIASYELLWENLLVECAKAKKDVVISTGMATMPRIEKSVATLKKNNCDPTILHCTSSIPYTVPEANLKAIESIRTATNCPVGWSDHTANPAVIYRAVHKWNAKTIEFHLDMMEMALNTKVGTVGFLMILKKLLLIFGKD